MERFKWQTVDNNAERYYHISSFLLWPSALFADMVIDRLARKNHPYPYKHLSYKDVGHFVCFPYGLPSLPPMLTLSPGGGMLLNFGGKAKAHALAASESWSEILAFLEESLKTTD
jgi:BAAT / Acyl-CoA thioester hydrolase C terminal